VEKCRILEKIQFKGDDDIKKNSAKCTKFEVLSLGLELQDPSLGHGVFDEVSLLVSSRNFNQVSVSTTSLFLTLQETHCKVTNNI